MSYIDKLESELNVEFEVRTGEAASSAKMNRWISAFSEAMVHIAEAVGQSSLSMKGEPFGPVNQPSCARSVGCASDAPVILKSLPGTVCIPSALVGKALLGGNRIPVECGCVHDWNLKGTIGSTEECAMGHTSSDYYRVTSLPGAVTPVRNICRNYLCPHYSCTVSRSDFRVCGGGWLNVPHVTYLNRNYNYRFVQIPKDDMITVNSTVVRQYCGMKAFNQHMVKGFLPAVQHSNVKEEMYSYDPDCLVYEFHGLDPDSTNYHLVLTLHNDGKPSEHRDTIPPSSPGDVEAVSAGVNSVTVSWRQVDDLIDNYVVAYKPVNGSTAATTIVSPYADSTTISSLITGTKYEFRVRALDKFGNASHWSTAAYATPGSSGGLDSSFAAASTKVTATRGSDHVTLTWNDVSNAETYRIFYRANGGCGPWTFLAETTTLSYRDTSGEYRYYTVLPVAGGNTAKASYPVSGAPLVMCSIPAYTIVVAQDNTGDYSTISEAVSAAVSGDTILIKSGNYRDNIVVDRDINIVGANTKDVIIESKTHFTPCVTLSSADATISGVTCKGNCQGLGILCSSDNTIGTYGLVVVLNFSTGMRITGNGCGIMSAGIRACDVGISTESSGCDITASVSECNIGTVVAKDALQTNIVQQVLSSCRIGILDETDAGSTTKVVGAAFVRCRSGFISVGSGSVVSLMNSLAVRCGTGFAAGGKNRLSVDHCSIDRCNTGIIGVDGCDVTASDAVFTECSLAMAGDTSSDVACVNSHVHGCEKDFYCVDTVGISYDDPDYIGGPSYSYSFEPNTTSPLLSRGTAGIGTALNIGMSGGRYAIIAPLSCVFNRANTDIQAYVESGCEGRSESSSSGETAKSDSSTVSSWSYTPRTGDIREKITVTPIGTLDIDDTAMTVSKKSLVIEPNLLLPKSSPIRRSYDLSVCVYSTDRDCSKVVTDQEAQSKGTRPVYNWSSGGCKNRSCPWYTPVTATGAISVNFSRVGGPESRCCEIYLIAQTQERSIGYGESHTIPDEIGDEIPYNYVGVESKPRFDNLWTGGEWTIADFIPDNEFVRTNAELPTPVRNTRPYGPLAAMVHSTDPIVVYERNSDYIRSWKHEGVWYYDTFDRSKMSVPWPAEPVGTMDWSKDGLWLAWCDNRNNPASVHGPGYENTRGSDLFIASRDGSSVLQMTTVPFSAAGGTHQVTDVSDPRFSPDGTQIMFTGTTRFTSVDDPAQTVVQYNLYVMNNSPGAVPTLLYGEDNYGFDYQPVQRNACDWIVVDDGVGGTETIKMWSESTGVSGGWEIWCDHGGAPLQLTNCANHEPSATNANPRNIQARGVADGSGFAFHSSCFESRIEGGPPAASGECNTYQENPLCQLDLYVMIYPWIGTGVLSVTAPYHGTIFPDRSGYGCTTSWVTSTPDSDLIFSVHWPSDDADQWDIWFAHYNSGLGSYVAPTKVVDGDSDQRFYAMPTMDAYSSETPALTLAYQFDPYRELIGSDWWYRWSIYKAHLVVDGNLATIVDDMNFTPDETPDINSVCMAPGYNNQIHMVMAVESTEYLTFWYWSGLWNSSDWVTPTEIPGIQLHATDTITSIDIIETNVAHSIILAVAYYRDDGISCVSYIERRYGSWLPMVTVEEASLAVADCTRTSMALCSFESNDGFAIVYTLGFGTDVKIARRYNLEDSVSIETLHSGATDMYTISDMVAWRRNELVYCYYLEGSVPGTSGYYIEKHDPATDTWTSLNIGSITYRSMCLSLDAQDNLFALFIDPTGCARVQQYTFGNPDSFVLPSEITTDISLPTGNIYAYPLAITGDNYTGLMEYGFVVFVTLDFLTSTSIYMCRTGAVYSTARELALDWEVSDVELDVTQDTHYLSIPTSPLARSVEGCMDGIHAHPTEQFHSSLKDVCAAMNNVQSACGLLPNAIVTGPSLMVSGTDEQFTVSLTNTLPGKSFVISIDWGNGEATSTTVVAPGSTTETIEYDTAGVYNITVTVYPTVNQNLSFTGTTAVTVVEG